MSSALRAELRNNQSCSELNQLRNNGRIPAVLYGLNQQNQNIHVDYSDIQQHIRRHGKSSIVDLTMQDGTTEKVIINEVQKDNLKDRIVHVDFKRVNMNKPMVTTVPIALIGEATGAKQGGVVQFQTRELEIRCLPTERPETIPVYVSELEIGSSITIADLDIPSGVEVQHEMNEVIVSIVPPRLQPVEEEPTDEIQEPEVVGARDSHGLDEAK
ncbi:50S ribosomal protein L25 [Ammoniphilus sp. CFH 90114]|uniref:50S ribosomal protein L25 n=1 Tax=Ammoniphilus sp. CFH 90114 TaxID=2493665 RepID=UPI00100E86C8|nr:50S ribosomal protein L25 [Ammoniphilus sp. CFH 90114]RXT09004.1 50S ribosomal protein L25 [Ammoniphilus sp. CFH 90114]